MDKVLYHGHYVYGKDGELFEFEFSTVYKKAKNEDILIWAVRVVKDDDKDSTMVYTTTGPAGKLDKQKTAAKKVASTAVDNSFDRAIKLNMTKRITKLRTGYFQSVEEAQQESKPRICMLAKDLSPKDIDKIPLDSFPMYGQLKLNGIRGTYYRDIDKVMSRNLKEHDAITKIKEACREALEEYDGVGEHTVRNYLDFEVYAPGFKINEIVSMLRHGDDRLAAWVFDVPGEGMMKERLADMEGIHNCYHSPFIRYISTITLKNHEEVHKFYDRAVAASAEGIILREIDGLYAWNNKTTRSSVLQKVKPILSDEFKIVSVEFESRIINGVEQKLIEFICETRDGATFKNPVGSWSVEKRIKWYRDYVRNLWNINHTREMTIEFREWTANGKPFHIVDSIVRDYE